MITPCPFNLDIGIMVSSNLNFGNQVAVTDNGVLQVKLVQVHAATKQKKNKNQCCFVSFVADNINQNIVTIQRQKEWKKKDEG